MVLILHIILSLYLPLFGLFLILIFLISINLSLSPILCIFFPHKKVISLSLSLSLIFFVGFFYEVFTPIVLLLTNLYVLLDASIFFLSFYLQHKIVLMLWTKFREKSYYNMSKFCVVIRF